MFHEIDVFKMLDELARLISIATGIAVIAWHSGLLARRFGWNLGTRVFYLRYRALTKSTGKPVPMRADTGRWRDSGQEHPVVRHD